ncbi:hypothetical protein [Streptomyces sp. NPDC052107]|uniref:hypothetical protein n=1 Tax=Streptomyces sp. NPDC052107 TaxID=3155632 RepID=UPI00341526B8
MVKRVYGAVKRERLGGGAARTVGVAADEAPGPQLDHDALRTERKILQPALVGVCTRSEKRAQSGHTAPTARPLAAMSTVPKTAVTASTDMSSIPSKTGVFHIDASGRMTGTVMRNGRGAQSSATT